LIVRSIDRCSNVETDRGGRDRVIPPFGTVSSTRSALNNISAPAGHAANTPIEMASLKTPLAMLMNEQLTILATAAKHLPLAASQSRPWRVLRQIGAAVNMSGHPVRQEAAQSTVLS
jgi:hypothetical protein